jgi:MoaA/NifB/PqqE/SkfB family radical SAM enzyme
MRASDFAKIIEHMPPIGTAILQGIGEPLLNPEFLDICKIARASRKIKHITFHTNGVTRSPELLHEVSQYVDDFAVSVDTLNQSFVPKTRTGTSVAKLRERLEELNDLGIPFRINMVASRYNLLDIPSTLSLLNDIGKRLVLIQPFESGLTDDPGVLTAAENELLRAIIDACKSFLPNLVIRYEHAGKERKGHESFCRVGAPVFSPYILPSGLMTPCCRTDDASKFGYADLTTFHFKDLWATDSVQSYLDEFINKGDYMCDGCYENMRVCSTDMLTKLSVNDQVLNALQPAVNLAIMLNDARAAIQLANDFLERHPDNAMAKSFANQLYDHLVKPGSSASTS